ncbi:hypothetical protein EPO44_08450, partial [bacterium]
MVDVFGKPGFYRKERTMKKLMLTLVGACGLVFLCIGAWGCLVTIDGTAHNIDEALAVTVDNVGNVVAAGFITNTGTSQDFAVVKVDGAVGAELWHQVIDGTAHEGDVAKAVTVDGAGNVVAAGFTQNIGTGNDFTVIKFDGATGAELWRQVIDGTAHEGDGANAVTVDGAGNVVAAGFTQNTGSFQDFTVIKFNGASGAELWRQVIDGTAHDIDEALAVTVDGAGDVVAAGRTRNTAGTDNDFTVIKFDGTSGAELWRQVIHITRTFSNNQALAVTVDAAGDVVAAGFTTNLFSLSRNSDFTVIKFDRANGTVLWRQEINGTDNTDDKALAVTVDAAGDVVAAGF